MSTPSQPQLRTSPVDSNAKISKSNMKKRKALTEKSINVPAKKREGKAPTQPQVTVVLSSGEDGSGDKTEEEDWEAIGAAALRACTQPSRPSAESPKTALGSALELESEPARAPNSTDVPKEVDVAIPRLSSSEPESDDSDPDLTPKSKNQENTMRNQQTMKPQKQRAKVSYAEFASDDSDPDMSPKSKLRRIKKLAARRDRAIRGDERNKARRDQRAAMTKAERTAFNKNGVEAQKARRANFTPHEHEAHKKKGRDAWAHQTEERREEISLQRKQKYNEEGGKERVKARKAERIAKLSEEELQAYKERERRYKKSFYANHGGQVAYKSELFEKNRDKILDRSLQKAEALREEDVRAYPVMKTLPLSISFTPAPTDTDCPTDTDGGGVFVITGGRFSQRRGPHDVIILKKGNDTVFKKFVNDFIKDRPVLGTASVVFNEREAWLPLPWAGSDEDEPDFGEFEKHKMDQIWYDFFEMLPEGSTVIILIRGTDGLCIDPGSWLFLQARLQHKRLNITLVFSCTVSYVRDRGGQGYFVRTEVADGRLYGSFPLAELASHLIGIAHSEKCAWLEEEWRLGRTYPAALSKAALAKDINKFSIAMTLFRTLKTVGRNALPTIPRSV